MQAEVVPLGQLQVLEDDVKQHLAMIRLLHRGTGGGVGGTGGREGKNNNRRPVKNGSVSDVARGGRT